MDLFLGASTIGSAFNIQNNETGLNLDFMSYVSYAQAGRDPVALLDPNIFLEYTQKTFSIFFQNFVSSTVSLQTGGWAYQDIGEHLDVGPPVPNNYMQMVPGGRLAKNSSEFAPQNTSRIAVATVSFNIEMLKMNTVAFWVSITILIWLTITMSIITALQRWHLGSLRRNVESVADVLVLIAGSSKLLSAVKDEGVGKITRGDMHTKLGWFTGDDGRLRWGIEVGDHREIGT